jgi:DNA-directed RNA polymerase subunit RPC12/RpoP
MTVQIYECTRCGHEIRTGTPEFEALSLTTAEHYRQGRCEGCVRQARERKQQTPVKTSVFRMRP